MRISIQFTYPTLNRWETNYELEDNLYNPRKIREYLKSCIKASSTSSWRACKIVRNKIVSIGTIKNEKLVWKNLYKKKKPSLKTKSKKSSCKKLKK